MIKAQKFKNGSHDSNHPIWGGLSFQGKYLLRPTDVLNLKSVFQTYMKEDRNVLNKAGFAHVQQTHTAVLTRLEC